MTPAVADDDDSGDDGGHGGDNGDGGNHGNESGGDEGSSDGTGPSGGDGGDDDDDDDGDDDDDDDDGDDDDDDGDDDDDDGNDDDEAGPPNEAAAGDGAEPGGHGYVPDELVVANLSAQAEGEVRVLGFVVVEKHSFRSLGLTATRLRVPAPMTAPTARSLLASRYPDLLVDVNALYRPQAQLVLPGPDYAERLIGWGRAPEDCGVGMRLGLLDTAVDGEVAALRTANIVQRSFLPGGVKPAAREHGTAVAAILVGQAAGGGRGLLPGAELSIAEVFGDDMSGAPTAQALALLGGLDWFVARSVPVINLSLSGDANELVSLALRRVTADGTVLIAAVGNGGPDTSPAYPASEPGVIGVTALDSRLRPYAAASRGEDVDFSAPGVRIWTPGSEEAGTYNSGTSFAAPYVTAAVAAQMANGAVADPDRITATLAATVIDLGVQGKDPVFGWGLIRSAHPCAGRTQSSTVGRTSKESSALAE